MASPDTLPDGGDDALCLHALLTEALSGNEHFRVRFLAVLCSIERGSDRDRDLVRLRAIGRVPPSRLYRSCRHISDLVLHIPEYAWTKLTFTEICAKLLAQ